MKPFIAFAAFILLVVSFNIVYQQTLKKDLAVYEAALKHASEELNEGFAVNLDDFRWTEEEKSRFEQLKQQFSVLPNGDTVWYIHKRWHDGLSKTTGLSAQVNSEGKIVLVSYYQGSNPLNHQQVFIKVDGVIYDSTRQFLPNGQDVNTQQEQDVKEWGTYGGEQDMKLLEAIAYKQGHEILVRLVGEAGFEEFVLSPSDKKAISECVALHKLLKA